MELAENRQGVGEEGAAMIGALKDFKYWEGGMLEQEREREQNDMWVRDSTQTGELEKGI